MKFTHSLNHHYPWPFCCYRQHRAGRKNLLFLVHRQKNTCQSMSGADLGILRGGGGGGSGPEFFKGGGGGELGSRSAGIFIY